MLMEYFVLAHNGISYVVYRYVFLFSSNIVVLTPSYNAYC